MKCVVSVQTLRAELLWGRGRRWETRTRAYRPGHLVPALPSSDPDRFLRHASALFDGKAYLNIHTTFVPSGEIRGFLKQVPDNGLTLSLLGLGLAGLAVVRRRFV